MNRHWGKGLKKKRRNFKKCRDRTTPMAPTRTKGENKTLGSEGSRQKDFLEFPTEA